MLPRKHEGERRNGGSDGLPNVGDDSSDQEWGGGSPTRTHKVLKWDMGEGQKGEKVLRSPRGEVTGNSPQKKGHVGGKRHARRVQLMGLNVKLRK